MSNCVEELKHSVKLHLDMAGGPSTELCVYLVKIIDFLNEPDEDHTAEMNKISFAIVGSLSIAVFKSVVKRVNDSEEVSPALLKSAERLMELTKDMNPPDPIVAKNLMLDALSDVLVGLNDITGIEYPEISHAGGVC